MLCTKKLEHFGRFSNAAYKHFRKKTFRGKIVYPFMPKVVKMDGEEEKEIEFPKIAEN
jgi:hypothetical protein